MQRTLTGLKRAGRLSHWRENRGQELVRIWSGQWRSWWGPNRSGYHTSREDAGVYTLADALDASGHCGPEKKIVYVFLTKAEVKAGAKPTQEARGAAKLMLGPVP